METRFIRDKDIYEVVMQNKIPRAKKFLWIATSDIKNLHVHKGSSMVPFLEIISDLIEKNILVRLIHAKEPGKNFREDFDRYPNLIEGLERLLCPRVHFKYIVIDGIFAYTGSANLTGAGIGSKSVNTRNFEAGIITEDPEIVDEIMNHFDSVWMGSYCKECARKEYCPDYVE